MTTHISICSIMSKNALFNDIKEGNVCGYTTHSNMGVPSFSGRGEGGGGGGQDRARGRHLTAAYTLSAFGRFNQWGGGGGLMSDSVNEVSALSADSTSGRWMLSAYSQFSQWGCACM